MVLGLYYRNVRYVNKPRNGLKALSNHLPRIKFIEEKVRLKSKSVIFISQNWFANELAYLFTIIVNSKVKINSKVKFSNVYIAYHCLSTSILSL